MIRLLNKQEKTRVNIWRKFITMNLHMWKYTDAPIQLAIVPKMWPPYLNGLYRDLFVLRSLTILLQSSNIELEQLNVKGASCAIKCINLNQLLCNFAQSFVQDLFLYVKPH